MSSRLFTSESVTEGHPDKIADAISDAILDELLARDKFSRVAVETLITTGQVHIAGEVTTQAQVDYAAIAREVVLAIGFDDSAKGFDGASCGINVSIGAQAPEIAAGVDTAIEVRDGTANDEFDSQGAGDQGLMFGYACADTPSLMPMPAVLAHELAAQLAAVRHNGQLGYLRPDGKTQVTIGYDGAAAVSLNTIVVSTQHAPDVTHERITSEVTELVVAPVLQSPTVSGLDLAQMRVLVNPSGAFVKGGPCADTGLTGRKIIVDTYGGMARHGGGAFSGKDPSKVDRSGAYAMRWVAKNIVAAGLATRCEVQVAYAIGVAHPVGIFVETFGTGLVPDERIQDAVEQVFDLRPGKIIAELGLLSAIYRPTAAYGHFGRPCASGTDPVGATVALFPWEDTARAAALQSAVAG
ncbi:MAG: methionine adenosyltransferase [Actinobacteria bacterium]|nr:methionine adenosyltransferase [Actinomycetota bacterium]